MTRLGNTFLELTEKQAENLQRPRGEYYTVEVRPPRDGDVPETLGNFVRGIQEMQSTWLGIWNTSPVSAFEIRREAGTLSFQFSVPTRRLERKIRTHLANQIQGAEFLEGSDGLPVSTDSMVGGGLLTLGRRDWYPLRTEFDEPPANSIAASLHRHAFRDTDVVIQVLFQPVLGDPVSRWWWRRRAYQRRNYLKKEKEKIWGSRKATKRERQQANAVENKAGTNRFYTAIRILVVGAGEYTPSRVKELAGGFNVFESSETGQYLDAVTVTPLRKKRILSFCQAVRDRRFGDWSRRFQATVDELAALVSIPNRTQENIRYSQP